ncbi:diguanylate cyclase (GGDEF) domain-containing protein [Malonomonas rubra DSM 5091]|uniref:Diguanylate cyclase (GGDEF) domain-containing protein n=1 Tax=Malonomonas rubra DSM 5091 TaxID=1122189 RepID=A0A1M6G936_MALRU|nr:EAL domain-containing protein [Malonomonas rubra]SHJ06404.1 diguanylate cyclase (GGDEF) domain-containing protein [Malonomonas rubra DSM 5091]
MPEFFNVILDFMTQFSGGRGGIDHNVVQFGLAAILWGTLLTYARARRKEDNPERERLLIFAFSFGLVRELFMLGMAFILALGLVEHQLLHVVFPPLEHSLQYAAIFAVAGAFLQFLRRDIKLARRYLLGSFLSLAVCYAATFWWWGSYIYANPSSRFGQTWCDWLFHGTATFWLLIALFFAWRGRQCSSRPLVLSALGCFFFAVFLKIPDMAFAELYEHIYTPISHGAYLLGIFLLVAVYLREQAREGKRAKQQIMQLAYYDTLSGLPNRSLFYDRLQQALALADRSHNRFALLFLDLDNFKAINDTYGHACGDQLLKAVANRLRGCLRMGDTLARLGGDEFIILLPDILGTNAVVTVADKILQQMQKEFQLDLTQLFTSASIGIAFYPENGKDAEELMKHADVAMYAAKEQGRSRYHLFSNEMHRRIVERHRIADELRVALQNEDFVLHYQPQVDIVSEKIVGAEALVRWKHPQKGLIMPGNFIEIAEETGQIQQLGEWIFKTACKQLKIWLNQGLDDFKLAINLSAHRLEHSDFLSKVEKILLLNNINPQQIELELTESGMLRDTEKALELLNHLKLRGFALAMDDFGTGYSSLSYLKRYPFDQVKIDKSFIKGINQNNDDTVLVKTILSMAQHLKLTVVAEGVETYEQLAYLRELGCDRAQGFYFSRPVPPDEFAESLFASQFNSELSSA